MEEIKNEQVINNGGEYLLEDVVPMKDENHPFDYL